MTMLTLSPGENRWSDLVRVGMPLYRRFFWSLYRVLHRVPLLRLTMISLYWQIIAARHRNALAPVG